MSTETTELLQRTHDAIDAILRGRHDRWDRALAALRQELRATSFEGCRVENTIPGISTAPDAVMASMETETDPLPDCVAAAWDTELNPPSSVITIELDQETDGRWIAEVLEQPGCLAYGDTRLDAVRNVLEVLDEVTNPTPQTPTPEPQ